MTQFREFTTVIGHRVFVDCCSVLLITDGSAWKGDRGPKNAPLCDWYPEDSPLAFVCLAGCKEPIVVRGNLVDVVIDIETTANKNAPAARPEARDSIPAGTPNPFVPDGHRPGDDGGDS